ncbi:discoidin domain-containing protein [Streptomyces luteolus]|uniref:discoidin domain-containing protein n=1 Tax=Streptomyces luteolus TaxID=3043615 RepID=UPI0038D253F0
MSEGAPAILKNRRPDLEPTANLARCRPVSGSTPEPGRYAEAAVDGSAATAWVPEAREGSLRVDLARPATLRRVGITWTEPRPASHRVETSLDGRHWQRVTVAPDSGDLAQNVVARHVRVTVRGTSGGSGGSGGSGVEDRPGIGELRVE